MVVLSGKLYQAEQEIDVTVSAARSLLESVVERDEILEPQLDSRGFVPNVANILRCLAIQKYADFVPKVVSTMRDGPDNDACSQIKRGPVSL